MELDKLRGVKFDFTSLYRTYASDDDSFISSIDNKNTNSVSITPVPSMLASELKPSSQDD